MLRKSGFHVLAQKGPECRLFGKIESLVVARDGRKMRGHVFNHIVKIIYPWLRKLVLEFLGQKGPEMVLKYASGQN